MVPRIIYGGELGTPGNHEIIVARTPYIQGSSGNGDRMISRICYS